VLQFLKRNNAVASAMFSPVVENQLVTAEYKGACIFDIRKPKKWVFLWLISIIFLFVSFYVSFVCFDSFLYCFTPDETIGDVQFSFDGKRLLCASPRSVSVFKIPENKKFDGRDKVYLSFPTENTLHRCRFAGKDDELLVTTMLKRFSVWKLPNDGTCRCSAASPLTELIGHQGAIYSFSFNKSIGVLASNDSSAIKLWVPNDEKK